MFASFLSLIISLILFIVWKTPPREMDPEGLILLFAIVGALFLLLLGSFYLLFAAPLQKAEFKVTPYVSRLFRNDITLRCLLFSALFFPLISFAMAYVLSYGFNLFNIRLLFPIWVFFCGVEIDLCYFLSRRALQFLDPYEVVTIVQYEAIKTAATGDETQLCGWIDTLCETSRKALDNSSPSLATQAFNQLVGIQASYVEACKKREVNPVVDPDPDAPKSRDRAQYILYCIYERLHSLYSHALEKKEGVVCLSIITLLGKLAISTAKYDLELALYPLRFVSHFALAATAQNMPEIGLKSTFMLQETGKTILSELDFSKEGLKTLFMGLNGQLEEVSKNNFKHDKSISPTLLMKPFLELKAFLKTTRMTAHPDSAAIVRDIDRVLEEFVALGQVMARMPVPGAPQPGMQPSSEEEGKGADT